MATVTAFSTSQDQVPIPSMSPGSTFVMFCTRKVACVSARTRCTRYSTPLHGVFASDGFVSGVHQPRAGGSQLTSLALCGRCLPPWTDGSAHHLAAGRRTAM